TRIDISTMIADQNKLYICGNLDSMYTVDGITMQPSNGRVYMAQLSANSGQMTWARQAQHLQSHECEPRTLVTDDNHNVTMAIETVIGIGAPPYVVFGQDTLLPKGRPSYMVQYDASGNYNFSTSIGDSSTRIIDAAACDGKYIYISGRTYPPGNAQGSYLVKVDNTGNQKWKHIGTAKSIYLASKAQPLYILFQFRNCIQHNNLSLNTGEDNFLVARADTATGSIQWHTPAFKRPVYTYQLIPDLLSATGGGGLLVSGATQRNNFWMGYSLINDYHFTTLIKDTAYTPAGNNLVTGNIFNDTDANCTNTNEKGLPEFGVIATPGPYFAMADAQGNYKLQTDTGSYNIELILPMGHHFTDTPTCISGGHNITFTGTGQTQTGYDFPNKFNSCTLGMIRGGQSDKLWCNKNVITQALVSNLSRDTMFNNMLTIKYPGKIVSPVTASIAWTSYSTIDSTMIFNLPAIPPDSVLQIEITDAVQCPAGMNKAYYDTTLNYHLKLTPLNTCYPEDSIYNYHTVK
ncbi:MAG: hypothetical protein K8F30_07170, partial [Taibaiella sp.]|nr:hypothetical protein [Taibaiella sp.]